MARKAIIEREKKRALLVEKHAQQRAELKRLANDPQRSFEEQMEARRRLHLLPKNSSHVRQRNRCFATGRPRGYIRFFGMCRIVFREQALLGNLPGIRKASL
ncbi:MAG: 30S ribosomal protein S14 [Chloroflexi bacterium]|nr:30S ribosomal protein S14 [Chloroflexota bacterium]MYF79500.1 30S ribosomal protein S14 [Chloroflexota bacterium]MYK60590.1 30S ribosomal protein S14 [Chloroflexota bacterium]